MWMGKIGNKSAAFIRHKHFHPGTYQNMEKVWLAEEKQKAEIKRQKEMKEKREEELRTLEIKRQIREQEELQRMEMILEEKKNKYKVDKNFLDDDKCGLILTNPKSYSSINSNLYTTNNKINNNNINKDEKKLIIRSQYKEDIFRNGHTSVYGSYYDRKNDIWGYKCCKETNKDSKCPNSKPKYKRKPSNLDIDDNKYESILTNKSNKKPKHNNQSLTESLKLLKQMDALE